MIIHQTFDVLVFLGGLLNYQIAERWPIEKIRSCSWLANQNFTKEFDSFPSNLSNYSPSLSKTKSAKTSLEYQAYSKLEELGITSEVLRAMDKNSNNNRDNINGTYRIIFHRLQKQSNSLERNDSYDNRIKEDLSSSRGRSISFNGETGGRKNKQHLNNSSLAHTKVCIIL
jgi:hypothetical protein